MNEISIEATTKNLYKAIGFVNEQLKTKNYKNKVQVEINIAVEEIFTNISSYAYKPSTGEITIKVDTQDNPPTAILTFIDKGKPYNPLLNEDPDVTLHADQREVGGLGIFIVKKVVDDINYEYINGNNVLTIKKQIS